MSSRPTSDAKPARWISVLLAVAGVLAFCSLAVVTRSSWASGAVTNSGNTAATGSLAFTHTYAAGPTCSAGPGVSSVLCNGTLSSGQATGGTGLTSTDAITNNGNVASAALSQSVALNSCEPVSFANSKTAANPLVDRYGTSFNQTGPFSSGAASVAFDGTAGYATSVVLQTQPPGALSLGVFSGLGIWFKAPSGTKGPLFSFGASASNGSGNVDRTLYLNSSGQLTFVWNTSGSNSITTSTSGGYTDGGWHFAYVTLGGTNLLLATIPQVTLYVDGTQRAQTPAISLGGYTTYQGFWHVGYAPTATTGLTTAYFGGSLADFVVFDGSSFPTPTTLPSSTATFATFATNATEWWPLNDNGTTTFTGTLPGVGAGSGTTASAACKSVDLAWSFTGPNGTATSSATSLFSWVTAPGSISTVGAPAPAATQAATLTITHDALYDTYVAGLHLWVPMTSTISVSPGAHWSLAFGWTPSASTTIIPSP